MKKIVLGIALVGLAVACKNTENTQVSDPSTAAAPEACATDCETECATACEEKAASCEKASSCDSEKVCPVTGKPIEN